MARLIIMRRPSGVQMPWNAACWKLQADMFSGPTSMSTYITRCKHQGWIRGTGKYINCFELKQNFLSNFVYIINIMAFINKFVCHIIA